MPPTRECQKFCHYNKFKSILFLLLAKGNIGQYHLLLSEGKYQSWLGRNPNKHQTFMIMTILEMINGCQNDQTTAEYVEK